MPNDNGKIKEDNSEELFDYFGVISLRMLGANDKDEGGLTSSTLYYIFPK